MGDQSFWRSCENGDIEGVQAAIDNGADVNDEDIRGRTGLMRALLNSHRNDVVQLLLNHPKIDINRDDRYGQCALHYAVSEDNHEVMEGWRRFLPDKT